MSNERIPMSREGYDKNRHVPEMQHIDYGLALLDRNALASWPENEPRPLKPERTSI